jgi:superfamily II DNA or RNA helicase
VTHVKLRPYQLDALNAARQAYVAGNRNQLLGLPTGCGKTVVFGSLIGSAVQRSGWRALVLAHRDELIEQAQDKLLQLHPELAMELGVVKAQRHEADKAVVVASVQTLHYARLVSIPRDAFDLVVVDEAHHAAATTYQAVLRWFGCLDPGPCLWCTEGRVVKRQRLEDGQVVELSNDPCHRCEATGTWPLQAAPRKPLLLGVTATPERADGKALGDTFTSPVIYHASILDMIRAGYLCDMRGIACTVEGLDLDAVKQSRGDYQDGDLGEAMEEAEAPVYAADAYVRHAAGRSAIVFCPTIALSESMREAFLDRGVVCEHLDGTTPADERAGILQRLQDGTTTVVTNCGVLTEGFDCPRVSCIIMARPTRSKVLYVQCVGRGTRLHPDKEAGGKTPGCLVIDLMGNTSRHSLITTPKLLGDQGDGVLEPETVEQMEQEGLSIIEAMEWQQEAARRGVLKARQVDLFTRRQVRWIEAAGGWAMPAEKATVVCLPDGPGRWQVQVLRYRQAPEVLVEGVELGYAQGAAEDWVREQGAMRLADQQATWRTDKRPASQKQRSVLWAMGLRKASRDPELTAGDASDLITAGNAKQALEQAAAQRPAVGA